MDKSQYEGILACPKCHSPVLVTERVTCVNSGCGQIYNIIDDIPVMIEGDPQRIRDEIIASRNKGNMFDRTFLGIPRFRINYNVKKYLYKCFGIRLPKLKNQRDYWLNRGNEYCDEFRNKGYENLEIFFQNLVVKELKELRFDSIFEAGCGFGWNIKKFQQEFSKADVGGLDFSHTQLLNGKSKYIRDDRILLTEGDATKMPFRDNAYDVGFTLGVFMNINKNKIDKAIDEMIRVCRKYIVHMEYDEKFAAQDLRERRVFKTNIISHDYKKLYESRGLRVHKFLTEKDFGNSYQEFIKDKIDKVERWEQWEGPSKYILLIVEKCKVIPRIG
ncbi:MAG: methyltransferase domain-containing protein [Bacteroidia bacterium]|nr:methyltransferase domain-containing protein [Bacteroidia bacterium]